MATPELFAEALFTDTSSWTVIDRGPFEALLPITVSFEKGIEILPLLLGRGREGCGWTPRVFPAVLTTDTCLFLPRVPHESQIVLERMVADFDPASPGKAKLEVRVASTQTHHFLLFCC